MDVHTCSQLMRAVKCNAKTARTAMEQGLTERQADNWACRNYHHPIDIWPDWYTKETT